ncbi:OmpA family protein [uncultured Sulfitobacter sp.]|uniref:OmpA family protein n=1 Tax=uncultured Sulfitobacter sp. TaxID=191468 RepID=UPI0030DCB046|tara:strand:- start:88190 stop:89971 length:1782 start_codon:yes stop_codon:yes gene_type:complete
MFRILKSTTSLTMCVALALPSGGFAQSATVTCAPEGAEAVFPCVLADGTEVLNAEQLAEQLQGTVSGVLDATGAVEAPAEVEADASVEAEAAVEAQAASDAVAAEAEVQAAELEAQAAEAAAAAQEEAIAAQIAADAEAKAVADQQAADQAAAQSAAREAVPAAEPAPAAQAEGAPAAQAEVTAEPQAEAAAETAAPVTPAPEVQAEAAPAVSPQTEEQIAAELAAQQAAEEARQEQHAAEASAAAEAAAAADSGEAEAQVETEEVTTAQTRSSDQEFETQVTGDASATAAAQAAPQEDDGMSKFEKALLLGLGAVAVGAVLKNGSKVVSNSGDRLVVEDQYGDLRVLKDDDALVRQAGDEVRRETFNDGSARTTVTKPDGSQVVTILGRDGTVLRRINIDAQGNEYVLFDDTREERRVVVNELPQIEQRNTLASQQNEEALRIALETQMRGDQAQRYSLRQVRDIRQVRALAPEIELDAVRFATGSSAIRPEQAKSLAKIGTAISNAIRKDPRTVILVEGHTDAVGDAGYNLALSDRRAETVALALTEYFDVPPANLITQGYGESALKVRTLDAEPLNRRAVVRNITGLLRQ